ncbi:MAG: cupin domain-containing protein [Candidatus Promineifilaceae bacterium]|nr:cupin domain-containing protein [Candidatus Promineifilaceae bacterium]
MSTIKQFSGIWGELFSWSGSRTRYYDNQMAAGVRETWLIGKAEKAQNFAFRYYELDVSGRSRLEKHAHDHGIMFLHGQGRILLGEEWQDVAQGDVVYIEPNQQHQILNTSQELLGFICVIPAVRVKNNKKVWAEEGLEFRAEITHNNATK